MLKCFLLFFIACGLSFQTPVSTTPGCPASTSIVDSTYSPGQVWSYNPREGESEATLTILKVEALPKVGTLVHIRVDGVRLKSCSGAPDLTAVAHAPFTREALNRSVRRLLRTGPVPDFAAGYDSWRQHCGGVYTTTVAEMEAVDEKTFNQGQTYS